MSVFFLSLTHCITIFTTSLFPYVHYLVHYLIWFFYRTLEIPGLYVIQHSFDQPVNQVPFVPYSHCSYSPTKLWNPFKSSFRYFHFLWKTPTTTVTATTPPIIQYNRNSILVTPLKLLSKSTHIHLLIQLLWMHEIQTYPQDNVDLE